MSSAKKLPITSWVYENRKHFAVKGQIVPRWIKSEKSWSYIDSEDQLFFDLREKLFCLSIDWNKGQLNQMFESFKRHVENTPKSSFMKPKQVDIYSQMKISLSSQLLELRTFYFHNTNFLRYFNLNLIIVLNLKCLTLNSISV